jgi:hypothetical protein
MSSEPPPPPQPPQRTLSAANRITSSSQDVPAQGRLADVSRASTPALTREGNIRTKFLPKVVARKTAEYPRPFSLCVHRLIDRPVAPTVTTGVSLLSDKNQRTYVWLLVGKEWADF